MSTACERENLRVFFVRDDINPHVRDVWHVIVVRFVRFEPTNTSVTLATEPNVSVKEVCFKEVKDIQILTVFVSRMIDVVIRIVLELQSIVVIKRFDLVCDRQWDRHCTVDKLCPFIREPRGNIDLDPFFVDHAIALDVDAMERFQLWECVFVPCFWFLFFRTTTHQHHA